MQHRKDPELPAVEQSFQVKRAALLRSILGGAALLGGGVIGGRAYQGTQDKKRVTAGVNNFANKLPEILANMPAATRAKLGLGLTFAPERTGVAARDTIRTLMQQ